jgi:hypothetical protein
MRDMRVQTRVLYPKWPPMGYPGRINAAIALSSHKDGASRSAGGGIIHASFARNGSLRCLA